MKLLCLTIAGSDPTSGAGIQADIRTFDRIGVHPFSAITAITYQTATDFYGFKSLSEELSKQLDAILNSYPIKYVKIGMIPDVKALDIIVDVVRRYELTVILDPVSISSAGERISSEGFEIEIERNLFPYVKILTPNINEASFYANRDLLNRTEEDIVELKEVAKLLVRKLYTNNKVSDMKKAVVIKNAGGNQKEIFDLLCVSQNINSYENYDFKIYKKPKLFFSGNVHGTGCVFSSAIAAFLAKGDSLDKSIEKAEKFFDEKFQKFIEWPKQGKVIDLTISEEKVGIITQIKEIYSFISKSKNFSKLIPEVRMNISGSLANATTKEDIAGIEGRITIINGYPQACGEIKFGISDHTARLILEAKKFDNSINFVLNIKYKSDWITSLQQKTDLILKEIDREHQPKEILTKEESTMQWLIKKSIKEIGRIPDIIWDKGSIGKEPMLRLFGRNSKEIIDKLKDIISLVE
ncbi:MAG: bifunctional hydroxymethylpyrimidine kinase/phosphomethylpyrimidine kinase [Promethearchaeota archaeon]